jgi:hypothetical protein
VRNVYKHVFGFLQSSGIFFENAMSTLKKYLKLVTPHRLSILEILSKILSSVFSHLGTRNAAPTLLICI